MVNLRQRAEIDLQTTLEKEWKIPVVLISPDGVVYDKSVNDNKPLGGQVLYDTLVLNPETGDTFVTNNPVVTLRRSSLARVPLSEETWIVKIPTSPDEGAPIEDFVIDPTRSPEGGKSIGFIRLYLIRAEQS